jgi:chromosome segregation ATPase
MSANALLVDIKTPQPDDSVKSGATAVLAEVRSFNVASAADYETLAGILARIKGRWGEVEEERVKLKAPSLEGCRRVDAFFAPALTNYKTAEEEAKKKLDDYDKEQRRLAAVKQAELDAIARKEREKREAEAAEAKRKADEKAAAERKAADDKRRAEEEERRKAAQAEADRKKAEREAAEAKARGDREAAEKAEREAREARERQAAADRAASAAAASATKLETRAEQTEQRGAERAELLHQQAASVVAPTVQVDVPKVKGLNARQEWKHRGVDLMALVKAVYEGRQPLAYLDFNHPTLAGMAKALKKQMNVPGVEVYPETVTASKATR